jgi:hypothetical protein
MIDLSVDECYAFDYLSILEVKKNISLQHEISFIKCCNKLKQQLGYQYDIIIASEEYEHLLKSNKKTFDAVEKARYGTISAKEVDDCNMERYHAKMALQKRFFKGDVVEKKT